MATLNLQAAVGRNCPNKADDVKAVAAVLSQIGKLPLGYRCSGAIDDALMNGIAETQRHWMIGPDAVISVGGRTQTILQKWAVKPVSPGVQLPNRLKEAWDWVNPLLPQGSYCSSGYRSADVQRKILQDFYRTTFKAQIVGKYTQKVYDEVAQDLTRNEARVLEMVRGVGQAIAAPGRSAHQLGKAVDLGGPPAIDRQQVDVVKLVARAHPGLFSGKVLMERNGCVHFEIV
jgi:hypothetical protein